MVFRRKDRIGLVVPRISRAPQMFSTLLRGDAVIAALGPDCVAKSSLSASHRTPFQMARTASGSASPPIP